MKSFVRSDGRLLDFKGGRCGEATCCIALVFVVICVNLCCSSCFFDVFWPFWPQHLVMKGFLGWRGRQTMERERCGAVGNRSADFMWRSILSSDWSLSVSDCDLIYSELALLTTEVFLSFLDIAF